MNGYSEAKQKVKAIVLVVGCIVFLWGVFNLVTNPLNQSIIVDSVIKGAVGIGLILFAKRI